jgi:uncharacterized RDD family membrane protein YckC
MASEPLSSNTDPVGQATVPTQQLVYQAVSGDYESAMTAAADPATPEWARQQAEDRFITWTRNDVVGNRVRRTTGGYVELATVPTRGFTYAIIDTTIAFLIVGLIWSVGFLVVALPLSAVTQSTDLGELPTPVAVLLLIAIPLGYLLFAVMLLGYYAFSYAKWGRTVGMRWLGMKVVDRATGENLTWKRAWVRSLVLNVALVVPFLWVLWWALTNGWDKQGPHDKAARSIVVNAPKGKSFLVKAARQRYTQGDARTQA